MNAPIIPQEPPFQGGVKGTVTDREARLRRRNKPSEARDEKVPPSAKSGGIPEPSPEYLLRASFAPIRLPKPRPILVVIDLNGTMVYRPMKRNPTHIVARPHAKRFMQYCIDTFWVVVWSSARLQNVDNMCRQLLSPQQLARVVAVWGREHFGLAPDDFSRRVQCYKRLTSLWADPVVAASHPDFRGGQRWNQGNTVLIDDSVEKARSEPHNLVAIPEFLGDVNERPEILPLVHDYLNELAHQSDLSTFMRTAPFLLERAV